MAKQFTSEKEFDRSICFSFFGDYRDTAKMIEEQAGTQDALAYYNAIADYALYDIEPQYDSVALKLVWPTTKTTLDASIRRRKRGFAREDTDQTKRILEERAKDPDATQRELAERAKASIGKVNKVLSRQVAEDGDDAPGSSSADTDTAADTNPDSITGSNTGNEREREHSRLEKPEDRPEADSMTIGTDGSTAPADSKRTVYELDAEELLELRQRYEAKTPYRELYRQFNIVSGGLSKGVMDSIPDLIRKRRAEEERKEAEDAISRSAEFMKRLEESSELLERLARDSRTSVEEWLLHAGEVTTDLGLLSQACDDGFLASLNVEMFSNDEVIAGSYESYWDFMAKSLVLNYERIGNGWKHKSWING